MNVKPPGGNVWQVAEVGAYFLAELLLIFRLPEILRNSRPHAPTQVTLDGRVRVESLGSNHGVSECIFLQHSRPIYLPQTLQVADSLNLGAGRG